jgi:bla regulator protein BlaR1
VFGILRPVLLWPAGISERLVDAQLEAILAHEMSHVRRRDNLAAALHMLVEAVFWFHPLVWWIGARLVEERETACDHEVLRLRERARSLRRRDSQGLRILFGSAATLRLGRQRVRPEEADSRGSWRIAWHTILVLLGRLLLAVAGIAAIAVPIGIGLLNAPAPGPIASPRCAHAPIRCGLHQTGRTRPARQCVSAIVQVARLNINNMPLKEMIVLAWSIQPFQISGGPAWIESLRYDISAKPDHKPKEDEESLMLQSLLADRFQLKIHHETKELPIYALVVASKEGKLGPQLTASKEGGCTPFDPSQPPPPPPDPANHPRLGAAA